MRHLSKKVLEALEWDGVLDHLASRCDTGPGVVFARDLEPVELGSASKRLQKITDFKNIRLLEHDVPDFSGFIDITGSVKLARKGGTISLPDLYEVSNFLTASRRIRNFLKSHREHYPVLGGDSGALDPLNELTELLGKSLTDSGALSRSAYPRLGSIEAEIASLRSEIEKQLKAMIHSPSISTYLQEKVFTTRGDRYVLLVKASFRGKIKGTVHDVSASEATLYVEPDAITDINNRMVMKEHDLKAETVKILAALSKKVGANAAGLEANQAALAQLDFLNAASRFSEAVRGNAPELIASNEVDLIDVRHPLLHLMDPDAVVPNTVRLGKNARCMLVTGANTGGKTVLLKTIGLCSLLAKHGLHIPAGPDSRIALFDGVYADIGDDQNLSRSLSTFSGQIVALREMLENADGKSLVLVDEIVVGTNPRQGAALARAILEMLAETGALIFATTHYPELKNLASSDPRFRNASVSFDPETFEPTYRLMPGIPGSSHAIEIAGLYGMPSNVTERARSLLGETELSSEALLEKVHRLDEELHRERDLIINLKKELEREKHDIEEGKRRLRSMEAEMKSARGKELFAEMAELRRKLSERAREIREADMRRLGEIRLEADEMEKTLRKDIEKTKARQLADIYRPFDPSLAGPGDAAFVVSLDLECIIESVDERQGAVFVLLGNAMKSRHSFDDLMLPAVPAKKKKISERKSKAHLENSGKFVPLTIQTSYNTIDLRGMRADEAVELMNSSLDSMVRSGIHSAVIIHGHGTGALKEAVRSALRFSSYAMDFRPGDYGEGGDGVTIALLRE